MGVFGPKMNDVEQLRDNDVVVTRVPMIPLYTLLFFKLVYVVAVILLAIGVFCFTHPAETESIREQLSVQGLAMAHFTQPGLRRANVVGQFQSQLASTDSKVTIVTESKERNTLEAEQEKEAKVGFVPTPEGTWTFALLVNEAWQSVKPIAKVIIMQEAKDKKLGI